MKSLKNFIQESIKNKPKTKDQLIDMIYDEIMTNGHECSLNHIDVSQIIDMSGLFSTGQLSKFNGDISKWDVSRVIYMSAMFEASEFDGDISGWNVSNVEDMTYMFSDSVFDQDISKWKINPDCDTTDMFIYSCIRSKYKPKGVK